MKFKKEVVHAYGPANLFNLADVTSSFIEEIGLAGGFVFIFSIGSTGTLINLNPKMKEDFTDWVMSKIPFNPAHRHPGNAFAHLRSSLIGCKLIVPVIENQAVYNSSKPYLLENTAGRKSRPLDFISFGKHTTATKEGGAFSMNVVTNKLELKANGWIDLVDVTQIADDFIKNSPIKDGMLNLYCQDAKSALITTEYEMDLVMDTADFIAKLVDGVKEHAKPQIASSFLGQAINIPIKDNRLNLGTWQQVIFVDLGQAGNKELMLQAVGI